MYPPHLLLYSLAVWGFFLSWRLSQQPLPEFGLLRPILASVSFRSNLAAGPFLQIRDFAYKCFPPLPDNSILSFFNLYFLVKYM